VYKQWKERDPAASMADVFVSYASEDRARVRPIVDHLEAGGWSVWWDRSVEPGRAWTEAIEDQLRKATCIVVVWSEAALNSPWVRLEANKARERKNLIPMNIDGVPLPPEFGVYQAIDFAEGDHTEGLNALQKSVRAHVKRKSHLRNIAVLLFVVLSAAMLGGSICFYTDACGSSSQSVSDRSLAIVPFNNAIQDIQIRSIADVFIDDLRDAVAAVENQPVASRGAMRAVPEEMSLVDVGKRLRVRWLLTGDVSLVDGTLHFAVELIDATTGYLHKGRHYQFPIAELESNRTVMAEDLLQLISSGKVSLLPERPNQPRSAEAYVLYLTGKAIVREQHDDQRLSEARRLFDLALALQPGYSEAEAGLCNILLWRYEASRKIEDFNAGELHCQRALDLAGRSVDVVLALGNLSLYKGDHENARKSLMKALTIDPYSAEAQIGLAKVERLAGDDARAESHLRAAIMNQPGFWQGYNELGIFLVETGNAEEAYERFQTAIDLSPDDVGGLNNLGITHIMSGNLGLAEQALRRVLSIQDHAGTRANLGNVYYWLGDYKQAAEQYQRAVEGVPDDYRLWANLGDAQRELSETDETAAYEKAREMIMVELEVNPDDAGTLIGLAAIEAAMGDRDQSIQLLEAHTPSISGDPNTGYVAAVAYARLGIHEDALSWLKSSVVEGFPLFIVAADPAFRDLHGCREFDKIINPHNRQ